MGKNDVAIRCNLVSLSAEGSYEDKRMLDHSADEIPTEEARTLIAAVDDALGTPERRFFAGVSYRNCLLWENPPELGAFTPPHDILGQGIAAFLPRSELFAELQKKSFELLNDHEINVARAKRGLKKANSIWFWSPGKKPALPSFSELHGLKGTVISAVDLMRGIALCAGMDAPVVAGATGTFDTDYGAKARAAIAAFQSGADYVYVHIEAPDECGHRAELHNKIESIARIDARTLGPVKDWLDAHGEAFRILLLPDHPTPVSLRTHTGEAVPFVIYDSEHEQHSSISCYCEKAFASAPLYEDGPSLLKLFLEK